MTLEEKKIYHQIHPVKLLTDFGTGFGAVYLLWQQSIVWALLLAFVPATVVSLWMIAKLDLEKYKNSAFGAYFRKYVASKSFDWLRFAGFLIMMLGGWNQYPLVIGAGFLVVLFCWLRGLFLKFIRPKPAA